MPVIFYDFSTGTFMWHNFMNKGAKICHLAGIWSGVFSDRKSQVSESISS